MTLTIGQPRPPGLRFCGWVDREGKTPSADATDGYHPDYYFDIKELGGGYIGPDRYGIEPSFEPCAHNEMVANVGPGSEGLAWKCADCGYVFGCDSQ